MLTSTLLFFRCQNSLFFLYSPLHDMRGRRDRYITHGKCMKVKATMWLSYSKCMLYIALVFTMGNGRANEVDLQHLLRAEVVLPSSPVQPGRPRWPPCHGLWSPGRPSVLGSLLGPGHSDPADKEHSLNMG